MNAKVFSCVYMQRWPSQTFFAMSSAVKVILCKDNVVIFEARANSHRIVPQLRLTMHHFSQIHFVPFLFDRKRKGFYFDCKLLHGMDHLKRVPMVVVLGISIVFVTFCQPALDSKDKRWILQFQTTLIRVDLMDEEVIFSFQFQV